MCAPRKFLCYPLPTSNLRTTLCRNSRESCSIPEDPLLCTSYFPLTISESRYAATRARTISYCSHSLLSNHITPHVARELLQTDGTAHFRTHIMPQLARGLSLAAAHSLLASQITPQLAWKLSYPTDTSCFQITLRRNSSKNLLIQGSLPTSYFGFTTPCRKSRENCLLLQKLCLQITSRRNSRESCFILRTLPACELHQAVTRVGSTSSTSGTMFFKYFLLVRYPLHHIFLPNHITPQLALKVLLAGSLPTFHSPLLDDITPQAAQRLPTLRPLGSRRCLQLNRTAPYLTWSFQITPPIPLRVLFLRAHLAATRGGTAGK